MKIPHKGMEQEQVLSKLKSYKSEDPDWSQGQIFGYVFHAQDDVVKTIEEAFGLYMWDNALDPSVFKSLMRIETEVVAMCAAHLGGDREVVGNFTSGGTESVLLAVKTARDWSRVHKPQIKEPEIILPITAHPCFHKGASYFDVKAVSVPVDSKTFQVKTEEVKKAINENTILLVGSAPCFSFGVMDPIEEMGKLAQEQNLLFHVDACMGGFILPFIKKLGHFVSPFDFSVEGVTSMSMDLHKYAFAAKGASVVLHKNGQLRRHQIFSHSGWTGYTIINPTIQSSKSAGPLAGAWAVLNYLGEDGYLEIVKKLHQATTKFIEGIEAIDDLYVMGKPSMCLIAVGSERFNIFALCDEMKKKGWFLTPQPGAIGIPEGFHITILPFNIEKIENLLEDLKICCKNLPEKQPSPMVEQIKAMIANLKNPSALTDEEIMGLLKNLGMEGGKLPTQMADANMLMNELPPQLVDRILTFFYDQWSRY